MEGGLDMGSVYSRKGSTGRTWYIDYRIGKRRIRERVGSGKAEAQRLLARRLAEETLYRDSAAGHATNRVALESVADAWLRAKTPTWTPRTATYYSESIDAILGGPTDGVPGIEAETVEQVTPHMVEDYSARLWRRKYCDGTVAHHVGALQSMLRWAAGARMIQSNPLADMRKPRRKNKRTKPRRALDPAEVEELLAASPECYRRIWLFVLTTGFRNTETMELLWEDLDLDAGTYRIPAARSKNGEEAVNPIPASTVEMLRRHKAECEAEREDAVRRLATLTPGEGAKPLMLHGAPAMRSGKPFPLRLSLEARAEREHVFVNMLGLPWTSGLRRKLKSCLRAAGIEEHAVDFHSLRVTFITHLVRQGVDIKTTQVLARHKTIQMTLQVYARSFPQDRRDAVDSLTFGHKADTSECHENARTA